jgi:hypothetical protein
VPQTGNRLLHQLQFYLISRSCPRKTKIENELHFTFLFIYLHIVPFYLPGVYFTSLPPDAPPEKLALNNFTNRGTSIRGSGLYRKIQYVLRITFNKSEVEKINVPDRDVYLHKGSIDLRRYEGRYKIYENPNCPIKY